MQRLYNSYNISKMLIYCGLDHTCKKGACALIVLLHGALTLSLMVVIYVCKANTHSRIKGLF